MKKVECHACGGDFALGETVSVGERCLCQECIEKAVAAEETVWDQVTRNVDATVCAQCGSDNGDTEFELLGGLGVCPACTAWFRNRPFPDWVKAAVCIMLSVSVLVAVYNWRFVEAYLNFKAAARTVLTGNASEALQYAQAAHKVVPESDVTRLMLHYTRAMDFHRRGESEDAHREFCACCDMAPSIPLFQQMKAYTLVTSAFDRKDYDDFLRLTIDYTTRFPDSMSSALLASAHMCKYACTRDEEFRNKALDYMAMAKNQWPPDDTSGYIEFEDRMMHRMETSEIIDSREFRNRFPEGYRTGKEKE